MSLFRKMLRAVKATSKYSFYLGSVYTFFGYFYVQEVKHRLGDSEYCQKKELQNILKANDISENTFEFVIDTVSKISNVLTFYSRTWHFREYERDCRNFHKNVIKSILRNYEEYGIFSHEAQMRSEIEKDEISHATLAKILQVKELNLQLINMYVKEYMKIVENQINLRTGTILGLSSQEKEKIDLIYNYIEKGEKYIYKNEEKYWQYKLIQSQTRRHSYSDTIFRLIFI